MTAVDTGSSEVSGELADGVLQVTLNRPEVRNALSLSLLEGVAAAIDLAYDSSDVKVVILTGRGDAFSAGGDVDRMASGESIFGVSEDVEGRVALQAEMQRRTVVRLHGLPKPSIAILRGSAVGAGLALALACDLRYASESAFLMTGFSRVGLAGDFGCSWLLHHLAGPAVAKEMLYRSARVGAEEAARHGLVNAVYADDQLESQTLRIARGIAKVSGPAIAQIWESAEAVTTTDLATACERDAESHVRLSLTPEHLLAVQALVSSMNARG